MLAETWAAPTGRFGEAQGAVLQPAFAHDVYHAAELNETLGRVGSPLIDLWD